MEKMPALLVKAGYKAVKLVLKKTLAALIPVLAPYAGVIAVGFIVFAVLFMMPGFMMENKPPSSIWGKIVSIFNLGENDDWTEAMDQELAAKYRELSNKTWQCYKSREFMKEETDEYFWPEIDAGLIPSEQEQAYLHRLPWSVLAGVDRIAGDPLVHKESGRKPNPEKHFEPLKPEMSWREFQALKVERVVEISGDGTEVVSYIMHEAVCRLLDKVSTFEGNYEYHWTEKKTFFSDGHLASIMPQMESIDKHGPYFVPLIDLMASYGITEVLELETVLELAELYDSGYKIDARGLGARIEAFQADQAVLFHGGAKGIFTLPVPLQSFTITSPFGLRLNPVTGRQDFHTGMDFGAALGTPVFSAFDGVVIWAGLKGGYGQAVMVDHGDIITLYGHLSYLIPETGKAVKSGDIIGSVGSTGISTGPHLHFETIKKLPGGGLKYEDPSLYLSGG